MRASLLLIQVVVGYEWLVSGLSKLAHGDFPAGLRATVGELSATSPGWYRGFLEGTVAPHAHLFAYAIEWSELLAGIVLLAAAAVSLRRGEQGVWLRRASAAALVAGLVLAVDFELANGAGFGLHLAGDSFDEGIDLDTIMVALQLALLVPLVPSLRRRHAGRLVVAARPQ